MRWVFENAQLSRFVCLGIHSTGFSFWLEGSHMEICSASYNTQRSHCSWQSCLNDVELSSDALQVGGADFGELCHLHLKTFAYLFLRPRDLGLPHSTAKQLSHCGSGRAAFLRLTGIASSCTFPPSSSINGSNNWLYFQGPCLLICLPTGINV